MKKIVVICIFFLFLFLMNLSPGVSQQINRPGEESRKFQSEIVEKVIDKMQLLLKDPELAALFSGCYPNTLDTTVIYRSEAVLAGENNTKPRPDTWVFTGDIEGMWLRDSAGQTRPYIALAPSDAQLRSMLTGVARRQLYSVLLDPYANAFNFEADNQGHQHDRRIPAMTPSIFEGKWELDSLAYVMDFAARVHRATRETWFLTDGTYQSAMDLIYHTLRFQQRDVAALGEDRSHPLYYQFNRDRRDITGGVVAKTGMIRCAFRPSDDETQFGFLVPANAFAVVALRRTASIYSLVLHNQTGAALFLELANEIDHGIKTHAVVDSPLDATKKILAYETDGRGNHNLMDDANVPSLLSLPYLEYCEESDPLYQNTRQFILSEKNPFFAQGLAGKGIGSPHTGRNTIWPMSIIMRAFTSNDDAEILDCLEQIKQSSAGTGLLHEAFSKDNAAQFSRSWFAWANSLFGQLILRLANTKPHLLFDQKHLEENTLNWRQLSLYIAQEIEHKRS